MIKFGVEFSFDGRKYLVGFIVGFGYVGDYIMEGNKFIRVVYLVLRFFKDFFRYFDDVYFFFFDL